jgi:hypothetical protein
MFSRKKGSWIDLAAQMPGTKKVTLATACISVSAESKAHYNTLRCSGRIVGVNDHLTESPQAVQGTAERGQA